MRKVTGVLVEDEKWGQDVQISCICVFEGRFVCAENSPSYSYFIFCEEISFS